MTTEQKNELSSILIFAIYRITLLSKGATDPQDKELFETVSKQLTALLSIYGGLAGVFAAMDYIGKHVKDDDEPEKKDKPEEQHE